MKKREKYIKQIDKVLWLNKSIFLVWARQVWKTSIMKYIWDNSPKKSLYINFDEIISSGFVEFQNLTEFINYINTYFWVNIEDYEIFLFDEVVRIKNFNIILKAFIDKYDEKNIIASASWNYEVIWEIVEWLAWRIVKIEVFPLDFREFLQFKWKNIDLDFITPQIFTLIEKEVLEFLTFGSYPEVVLTDDYEWKQIILKSIIDSVWSRDLSKFIREEKVLEVEKLVLYLSKNIWSLFSYEWLSNKLWIKLKDVKNYLSLLEKSYLIFMLNPFYTDKKLEYSKKQKIYFNNFWTINYFSWNLQLKKLIDWMDVEQTLFLNLRFNLKFNDKIFFYQKLNWTEIDFILRKEGSIYPIEASTNNRDIIPKSFNWFLSKYKDEIKTFYKTTTSVNFSREYKEWKKVIWKPFYSIF